MSAEDKSRIVALHDQMIRFCEAEDSDGCFLSDYEIHDTLVSFAQHEVLQSAHPSLGNRSHCGRYLAARFDHGKLGIAIASRRNQVEAKRRGAWKKSARIMHDHATLTGEFVIDTLRSQ